MKKTITTSLLVIYLLVLSNCGFKQTNDFWEYNLNNAFNMPDFIKTEIE